MPALIAAPIFWAAVAGGGATVAAGAMASHSAGKAANQQTAAANHAADLQSKAAADTLAFQRQQAEADFQNSETSRHGNYDQWAAGQRRLQTLNDLLGLGPRDIPDYVPGIDPNLTGGGPTTGAGGPPTTQGGSSTTGAGSGGPPTVDASKGDIAAQVSAYFKSRGVADTETPYWTQKWAEFGANDPAYFNTRLAAADIFGGKKSSTTGTTPPTTAPYKGTVNSWLTPGYQRQPLTPSLQMPGGY